MFIENLNLKKKMLFSILLFSLPISVLSIMMFQAQSSNIQFAEKELLGNMYQKPIVKLLRNSYYRRILNARTSNTPIEPATIKNLELEIDKSFEELSNVNKNLENTLEFTSDGLKKRKREGMDYANQKKRWEEIKAKYSEEKMDQLIQSFKTMISHLGDTSNLILDPDLDSYYMMDITLLALPQNQDRIQEISLKIEKLYGQTELSLEDRITTAILANLLKEFDLTRITSDSQTALNEDSNFYGISTTLQDKIPPMLQSYKNKLEILQKDLEGLSQSKIPPISQRQFQKKLDEAFNASYEFWWASIIELDSLLKKRISVLTFERSRNLVIALVALLFSLFFSLRTTQFLNITLSHVASDLTASGSKVSKTSSELNTTSQGLSASSTQTASSLEESVSSIEELSSMVSLNSKNSKLVSEYSSQAQSQSQVGYEKIHSLVDRMKQITDDSKKIEDIITVIEDIAFQTNLLALNAAVEAARAGEQGRGFAVVADSVRALAQRSSDAAKEISSLINNNVHLIRDGAELANAGGQALESIVSAIQKVADLNKDIANASEEQSTGLKQITQALNFIDQTTQKNAAASETLAHFSNEMLTESSVLQKNVAKLEEIVSGKK